MRVNVYGLTESTITFNTLNMILRGKYSEDFEECGLGSTALNIELANQDQINEMNQIEGLGLIRVERLDEVQEETEAEIKTYADEIFMEETTSRRQKAQELEEQPSPSNVAEVPPSAVDLEIPQEDLSESTDVIVMTENGPKSGKMVHKMNGEINEDDPRCKAAMDETQKLKEEEERLDDLIDDSVLDPSERMGSTAVVGTGNGKAETMSMKNSAVGEKIEPNFIDLEFDDEPAKPAKKKAKKKAKKEKAVDVSDAFIDEEKPVDDAKDAFIDLGEEEALGEEFIEI
jgi:hypothetical protein